MTRAVLFLLSVSTALAQTTIPAPVASLAASAQQPTAQISPASNSETDTAAKYRNLRFEVVSIRRNKSGGPQIFGKATPDGFEMRNMFLAAAIGTAYVPTTGGAAFYSGDQVVWPSWLTSDDYRYDLDAKVDEADVPDWQNPAKQPAMLRAMLQNMLADRPIESGVTGQPEIASALAMGHFPVKCSVRGWGGG